MTLKQRAVYECDICHKDGAVKHASFGVKLGSISLLVIVETLKDWEHLCAQCAITAAVKTETLRDKENTHE